jgi:hypothetical protein
MLNESFKNILILNEIKILFCQKIVRNSTKSLLLENNILVVDRLAKDKIQEIIAVTCTRSPLKQFNNELYPESIGYIHNIVLERYSLTKVAF